MGTLTNTAQQTAPSPFDALAALELLDDAVVALDREWRFIYVNARAEQVAGMPRGAMLGRTIWELSPATVGTPIEHALRHAAATRARARYETFFAPHGAWYAVTAYPTADGLLITYQDITARKQTEEQLRHSEQYFHLLAESIPQMAWAAQPDGTIDYYNHHWYDYTGQTPDEAYGWGWQPTQHPDDLPRTLDRWRHALATGETFENEIRFRRAADGAYRWHIVRAVALRDATGNVLRWFGTCTDIDDQKRAAEERAALLTSEREARDEADRQRTRLTDLFMQAPAAIAVLRGPTHIFELANPRYHALAGKQDLVGRPGREALPELTAQGIWDIFDRAYATGVPFIGDEFPVQLDRRGNGTLDQGYFNFVAQPYADGAGAVAGILIHAVEVTDQVRARQRAEELARQLTVERDRLQQVVDALPEGVIIADSTPRFTLANRTARDILGMDPAGLPMSLADDEMYATFGTRRLDGSIFPTADLPLARAALRGERVTGERLLVRNAATGRDTPILANAAPLHDAEGAVGGGIIVFQDIAEIVTGERTRDEFLAAASHDLKSPLTTIRGNAQLARRRLARLAGPDGERVAASLEGIESATARMLRIIDELIEVTRVRIGGRLELHRESIDLAALVRDSAAQQSAAVAQRLRLDVPDTPMIAAVDSGRIERVLANLIGNAAKYSPSPAPIAVRLRHEAGRHGPEAVIAVTDRGIGIPAADLPHIFERFRRAGNVPPTIQGSGIGLASVRQIVEEHGGTIAVESVEGVGTTFTVRLPLAPEVGEAPV